MKQVLQLPTVQESIFSNEIENVGYLVKLNRNGVEWGHELLRRFGLGTAIESHHYCWTPLLTNYSGVSLRKENMVFNSKKESVEWSIKNQPLCLIMAFDSEEEFLTWVEAKLSKRFGKRDV